MLSHFGVQEKKLNKAQRVLSAICSRARNAYAKEQLQADFQEGIAEMHAQGQGPTTATEQPYMLRVRS